MPAGIFAIKIGKSEKTVEMKPKGQKNPVADFSAQPTSGWVPAMVAFTDKSTEYPTSWKWDFGDESYSTAKNPVHTYNKPGKYTVTLTARNDAGGATITKSGYITVFKSRWQFFR